MVTAFPVGYNGRVDESEARVVLAAELTATRERIAAMTGELDAVAAASADSNLDDEHDPEGSTVAFEREQYAALRASAQRHLAEVQAALDRVDAGTFGRCERCGAPIGAERLAALPATRYCVRCSARRRG
jgi:RNA polymerase-binding transcription factor DksA